MGSVLILALWTLLMLGMLALAIGGYVSAGTRQARFLLDDATALALARGGIEQAIADLMVNPSNVAVEAGAELASFEARYRDNASLRGGTFSVYYTFDDTNVSAIVTNYGVLRESAKINIDNGPEGNTQRLAQVLAWLGAPELLMEAMLTNYPAQKTVAPDYLNRYGPYEALPELYAVPGVAAWFDGLEPLVTLREFEREYAGAGDAWQRRESYGGVAEGRAVALKPDGPPVVLASRRITFVFDRATTNLLYWREH